MGWKSTVTIEREEAMVLIVSRLSQLSNCEISDVLESMGFGDNLELSYFGHNFTVVDKLEDN